MKKFKLMLSVLLISGCSVTPQAKIPIATYNFAVYPPEYTGQPIQTGEQKGKKILIAPITAPSWLDTRDISYRLAYHNPIQAYTYAHSRWASPPAFLLTQQIKQRITDTTSHLVINDSSIAIAENRLYIELEEFSQIFGSEHDSHVMIRFRASLVNNTHRLIAQKSFSTLETTPTADAQGAADAFAVANNRLLGDLVQWLQTALNGT